MLHQGHILDFKIASECLEYLGTDISVWIMNTSWSLLPKPTVSKRLNKFISVSITVLYISQYALVVRHHSVPYYMFVVFLVPTTNDLIKHFPFVLVWFAYIVYV